MMRVHVELPQLHDLEPVVRRRGGLRPLPTARMHAFPDLTAGVAGETASPEEQAVRLHREIERNAIAIGENNAARWCTITPFCRAHTQIGWADDKMYQRGPTAADVLRCCEMGTLAGDWCSAIMERLWLSRFARKGLEIGLKIHTLFIDCEDLWGPFNLWVDEKHPGYAERSKVFRLIKGSTLAMARMNPRLRVLIAGGVFDDPSRMHSDDWREAMVLLGRHMTELVTRGIRELVKTSGIELLGVAGSSAAIVGAEPVPSVRVLQYPLWRGHASVKDDNGWTKSGPVPDARALCADEYAHAPWSVERLAAMLDRGTHAGMSNAAAIVPWLHLGTPRDVLLAQLGVCRAKGVHDVGLHGSAAVQDKPAMLAALEMVAEFLESPGRVESVGK